MHFNKVSKLTICFQAGPLLVRASCCSIYNVQHIRFERIRKVLLRCLIAMHLQEKVYVSIDFLLASLYFIALITFKFTILCLNTIYKR